MTSNIVIFGPTGRLGREFVKAFPEAETIGRDKIDLSLSTHAIYPMLMQRKPRIIINCSAMNGIESCYQRPDVALAVNAAAPAAMATAARELGSLLIHFSTDYTIASGWRDYLLPENEPYSFTSLYGASKTLGEVSIQQIDSFFMIFRLSSLYGDDLAGSLDPIRQALNGRGTPEDPIRVLKQVATPTSCRTVVKTTKHIIENNPPTHWRRISGIYNMVNSEPVWKSDFAQEAVHTFLSSRPVVREGVLPLARPLYCVLSNAKLQAAFNVTMPTVTSDMLEESRLYKERQPKAKSLH